MTDRSTIEAMYMARLATMPTTDAESPSALHRERQAKEAAKALQVAQNFLGLGPSAARDPEAQSNAVMPLPYNDVSAEMMRLMDTLKFDMVATTGINHVGLFADFPSGLVKSSPPAKPNPLARAIAANFHQRTSDGRPLRYIPVLD